MERSNQPPNTERCWEEGKAGVAAGDASRTTSWKRTQGTSQAESGCRPPLTLSSPETIEHAGGDAVASAEPNTEATVRGEVAGDLPGSQSGAREDRADGNLGGPEATRRANSGSETGRNVHASEECS